jgi:glycosyltransferase involved in cell wall biosynthesis
MRIGIDFHVLHHGWKGSGIRRYIEGMYRATLALPNRHEWVFFVEDPLDVPQDWPGQPEWQGFGTTSRLARLAWKTSSLLKEARIDCYHMQFVAPLRKVGLEAISIHDLLFETHPQFFPRSAQYTLAPMIRRGVRRAELILTISEYSRTQLIERYQVPPERICLTPCAIDRGLFHPGDREASRALVKQAYDLDDFILSVGRIEPRKNHASLVHAYAYLKSQGRELPRLVFVGGQDFGYRALVELIGQKGLEKDIVFLHGVADDMLPHMYRAALVTAYPSFAEGFGIPPLEAMACGSPVITSGTTALPEVVGDCGWLINPDQWLTLAQALLETIQDPAKRKSLAQKGAERSLQFSWENSARSLIAAYDRLC